MTERAKFMCNMWRIVFSFFSPPCSSPSTFAPRSGEREKRKKSRARAGEVAELCSAVDKNIRRGKGKKGGRKKEGAGEMERAPKYCNRLDLCGGK